MDKWRFDMKTTLFKNDKNNFMLNLKKNSNGRHQKNSL